MLIMQYFNDNPDIYTQYATPEQNSPSGRKEYVGTICYKTKIEDLTRNSDIS